MSEWIQIARTSEIPQGTIKMIEANRARIALANIDGTFYAIEDRCSHDDGPLGQGELDGKEVECPRHGARFDMTTGKPMNLPAVVPVKSFQVKVDDNNILIEL